MQNLHSWVTLVSSGPLFICEAQTGFQHTHHFILNVWVVLFPSHSGLRLPKGLFQKLYNCKCSALWCFSATFWSEFHLVLLLWIVCIDCPLCHYSFAWWLFIHKGDSLLSSRDLIPLRAFKEFLHADWLFQSTLPIWWERISFYRNNWLLSFCWVYMVL